MGKKFILVGCRSRTHKLFCDDVRKVYYVAKRKLPPVPSFEQH